MSLARRRATVLTWLQAGVAAVDPEAKTALALESAASETPATVIAIGKAAAAMCRGAAKALGPIRGVCVTDTTGVVPPGIDLVIGDHPVPGERSFAAGRRVLEVAADAPGSIIALISGGGSALCEQPLPGIEPSLIQSATQKLLDGGASIEETNLVRRHLSNVKAGGVARAAASPIDTYIISDVAGAGPEVVASGPTLPIKRDPHRALEVMERYGVPDTDALREILGGQIDDDPTAGRVTVIADGRDAAEAAAQSARLDGVQARVFEGWIRGEVEGALDGFLARSGRGVTVAAGEPDVEVRGNGVGGRNSHAALLAAARISGSASVFAFFATDGVDGGSDGAGGLVDGTTIDRGGDPTLFLARSDSATYLEAIGDLIVTGPTGTNVSDLWLLWRT